MPERLHLQMGLAERDSKVIWHPFTQQINRLPPIAITRGEGIFLTDDTGKQYIDAISSWWVTLHGHGNAYIAEKIYRQALQLEQVIFAGFTHEPAVALAERLLPLLPGNPARIFYSDNGSTSTEVALKMAIQYWWNRKRESGTATLPDRRKILAFRNSYHGDTFGAMSVSDRSVFTLAFHDLLFEVIFIDTPCAGNIRQLEQLVQESATEIAAFIYEPLVQGAGGMNMYESRYLDELLVAVKRNNILCIADEVMTGFGRTGKLFASEWMTETPDIICLSKGLTGGTMALGVTACSERIYEAYNSRDPLQTFFHGHSFTANPLACTAALASLDLLLEKDCLERIAAIARCQQSFRDVLSLSPGVRQARCLGTIVAFEIEHGKKEYLNEISAVFTQQALARNVYLRPLGNTVYLMPPYCITVAQLETVQSVVLEILRSLI